VLRVLVVKQRNGFSYEELHFHLLDSASYRTFCRFGALDEVPGRQRACADLPRPYRGLPGGKAWTNIEHFTAQK